MDFPGVPVDKNSPINAGDTSSIPAWSSKIPHVTGQLSLCATITEPAHPTAHAPKQEKSLQ